MTTYYRSVLVSKTRVVCSLERAEIYETVLAKNAWILKISRGARQPCSERNEKRPHKGRVAVNGSLNSALMARDRVKHRYSFLQK